MVRRHRRGPTLAQLGELALIFGGIAALRALYVHIHGGDERWGTVFDLELRRAIEDAIAEARR